jgi:hypothetical protein
MSGSRRESQAIFDPSVCNQGVAGSNPAAGKEINGLLLKSLSQGLAGKHWVSAQLLNQRQRRASSISERMVNGLVGDGSLGDARRDPADAAGPCSAAALARHRPRDPRGCRFFLVLGPPRRKRPAPCCRSRKRPDPLPPVMPGVFLAILPAYEAD